MLPLLARGAGAISWAEIVAGYDFSLLQPREVQEWVRAKGCEGGACLRLLGLQGKELLEFEVRMWEACAECFGRVPRPGDLAWFHAQDRWRRMLLRKALEADLAEPQLAQAIEAIYECVGCPEDMLGLWSRRSPWEGPSERVNFEALCAFLALPRTAGPPAAA